MSIKSTFILLFLSLSFNAFAQKKAVLVKNGQKQFSIIVPAKSAEADMQAALLLQSAVKKMAGCELPIVKTDPTHLKKVVYITANNFSGASQPA